MMATRDSVEIRLYVETPDGDYYGITRNYPAWAWEKFHTTLVQEVTDSMIAQIPEE
jgi:hypothetical protein